MSEEMLRQAAALMRERAEAATSGPWIRSGSSIETDHDCSPDHDCWPVGDTYSGMKPDGSTYPRDLNRSDAEHIASWHPAVALAVADWLEAEATSLDAMANFTTAVAEMEYETTVRGAALTVHKTEAGEITFRADTSAPALAVARAYLGSDR